MSDTHVWISGGDHFGRAAAAAAFEPGATADCHRRLRGPYTGTGSLMRALVPVVYERDPELPGRHAIEILTVAPELEPLIGSAPETLTTMAPPEERTRWYSRYRTRRVAHGIVDFLRESASVGPLTICLFSVDHADPTDLEFLSIALRRLDPSLVRLVVCSSRPVQLLASELGADCSHQLAHTGTDPERRIEVCGEAAAAAFVDSDCTSDVAAEREAYLQLDPAVRARLHDRRADGLEANGEWSLRLGAIPYHREHGTEPRTAGRSAYSAAINYCIGMAFYDAALELAGRLASLTDFDEEPNKYYAVQTAKAQCLAPLERPMETEPIYYDLLSRSASPRWHMNVSYALSMLYTRGFDEGRKDHLRARAHVNTAIAIASQFEDADDRAFHTVFMENGKALVEMHLGNLPTSLTLVTDGIERLGRELPPGKHQLHRSVLHHNRAQVLAALGRPEEALPEFDYVISLDPNYSEYRFDRANLLYKLGRHAEALAGYQDVIALSPPFPELYYNRGNVLAATGDIEAAIRDFRYVVDLEPDYVDAWVSLASLRLDEGDPEGALADVRAGLAVVPSDARLHCTLGLALLELQDPAAAHRAFDQSLALDPGLSEALVNRAVAAYEQGQYDVAIADLTAALETDEANPDLLYNRGYAFEAADSFEEAIADYTRALSYADADHPELLYRRGRCNAALGKTHDAADDLRAHLACGASSHQQEICDLLGTPESTSSRS
jgi:tetratricopeptide (TPR) repeat protein